MSVKINSNEFQVNSYTNYDAALQAHPTLYPIRTRVGYAGGYGFSSVNAEDKTTVPNKCCITLIGTGESPEGPQSFLMHISPNILGGPKSSFVSDLQRTLIQLKGATREGSMRALVVGGYAGPSQYNDAKEFRPYKKEYIDMIDLVERNVQKQLAIGVEIHSSPKTQKNETHVAVLTNERNVVVVEAPQPGIVFDTPVQARDLGTLLPYGFSEIWADFSKRFKLDSFNK